MSSSSSKYRRLELSDAAYVALTKYGFRGATLEKVAEIAGVSKSVLLHNFKDKNKLFEDVFRRNNTALRVCVVTLLNQTRNPWERLYAIINGNFVPTIFKPEISHCWISLIAEAPYIDSYQHVQSIIHARMRSNLISALKHILPEDDIEKAIYQITAMIDGIWLRQALQKEEITQEQAMDQMYFCLDNILPKDPESVEKSHAARERIKMVSNIIFTPDFEKRLNFRA